MVECKECSHRFVLFCSVFSCTQIMLRNCAYTSILLGLTAVSGACFGSTHRCTIADAIDRSNLSAPSASGRASLFDPIAFIHSICNILQHAKFRDVDCEQVVVAVARICAAVAADALVRNEFLSAFSKSSCFHYFCC